MARFCHRKDLGKTVTVVMPTGETLQRSLSRSWPPSAASDVRRSPPAAIRTTSEAACAVPPQDKVQGASFDEAQYDILQMKRTHSCYEVAPKGQAWSDMPYGEVEGNIEGIGYRRWKVHAVLGKGDCKYLALAIAVFKQVGHLRQEAISARIQSTVYRARLDQVAACGERNVKGEDLKGMGLRRLLANHLKESPALVPRLANEKMVEKIQPPVTRRNRQALTPCEMWIRHTETAGNYWNDVTDLIWQSFLGELVLLRTVLGTGSCAAHFKLALDTEIINVTSPPIQVFLLFTSPAVDTADYSDRGDGGHFSILLEVENDQLDDKALAPSAAPVAAAPPGDQSSTAVNAASVARCVDLIWLGRAVLVAHSTLRPFKGGTRWFFPCSQVLFPL